MAACSGGVVVLPELLEFVSAEADAVPPESLFTRVGIRTYDADPAQFTRAALTARRAELVAQWAGWRDKECTRCTNDVLA